jgi:hypothetical protein
MEKNMIDKVGQQAQEMLEAIAKLEVPAKVRAMAEESVAKAREVNAKWNAASSTGATVLEETVLATQAGIKTVAETVMANTMANAEAAFDAAQKLARAKSLAEVAQIQAKFAQEQLAKAGEQAKALLELSTKAAKETNDTLTAIAAKAVEDLKKLS